MHAHATSLAALRAECVAVAYKITKLFAALEKTNTMLNAVAPASPMSPVMADIAPMGDKAGTVSVRDGEKTSQAVKVGGKIEVNQAVKIGGKIEVDQAVKVGGKIEVDQAVKIGCKVETGKKIRGSKMASSAFDNDDTMAAVAHLFTKPPKSARKVDALARDDVLRAVARMFGSHKAAIDALANDATMGAVAEMFSDRDTSQAKPAIPVERLLCVPLFLSWVVLFGQCIVQKPRMDALADDGAMAAVASLFKEPKSSKRVYNAYSDDLVLLTVKRMFGGAIKQKPAIDALADNGIMEVVSAMFKEPKPVKHAYDPYSDDFVLLTVKRMFGKAVVAKPSLDALADNGIMQAVATMFREPKPAKHAYNAYSDDLELLNVKRMFGGADGLKPAIYALAEEGIMDAVAALFEHQPAAKTGNGGALCPILGADNAATYKATSIPDMAVCKSCISAQWPDLRLFSCVESRENLEVPDGDMVHETKSLHSESDEPETNDIAVRDNEPEKAQGRPIDATFGMGSLVQKAYAKAPPSMMLGMAVRAGLRAPWSVPALQRVPDVATSSVDLTKAVPSD